MESDGAILYEVISILGLLSVSSLVYLVCKKIQVPFAVGLLLSGIGIALSDQLLIQFGVAIGNEVVLGWGQALQQFDLSHFIEFSPAIVFFVFLPTLIFESAYHLNYRTFRGVIPEVLALSLLGLAISIVVIGSLLHYIIGLPWSISLLFGSLISATDPVAVLAIFKEMRIPKRLSTIVDGESLLNDGTALIIFQIFLAGVLGAHFSDEISALYVVEQGGHLLFTIVAALVIGAVSGWLFSFLIAHSQNKGVQLTLSIILAHVTFIFSEVIFHASGILATMVAGVIVGNFGKRKMNPGAQHSFKDIWQFLGFISNSLVFLLLGAKLGQVNFDFWPHILIASVVVIFVARPLSVFCSCAFTNAFRSKDYIMGWKDQVITTWGGLRGALAAAAVLLIPASFPYAEQLQAMTAGVIFMTFVLNAMTMKPLLKWLKFQEYTVNEEIQFYEAKVLINEKVVQHLKHIKNLHYITPMTHDKLAAEYKERALEAERNLESLKANYKNNAREIEKILTHYALGIELRGYKKLFHYNEISEDRLAVLVASINRQLVRLERDELPEERKTRPKIAPPIPKQFVFESKKIPFIGELMDRFYQNYRRKKVVNRWQHYRARRIASSKVIRDLGVLHHDHEVFADAPVLEKIIARYKKWHKNAEKKIKDLEKDFPEILDKARMKLVENMCLNREQLIEKEFLDKGFICDKVFADLEDSVTERSKARRKIYKD